MAGHPPFGAQIILHEYLACQAREAGIPFTKEGNCFTVLPNLADLARVADNLIRGRDYRALEPSLRALDLQRVSLFRIGPGRARTQRFFYHYSVDQVECSRNLIFQRGSQMEHIFQGLIDRMRARLTVTRLKTIFGVKSRPHRDRRGKAPRLEVVVETPAYDLTIFKLHFGKLTLKVYTKGERVLRFEAIVHNTKELRCGRLLERFPQIVARLQQILEQFLNLTTCTASMLLLSAGKPWIS